MRDITTDFKNAISLNVLWAVKEFFETINLLTNNQYEVSFWENEENWATIFKNKKIIGYLWRKYPLFFILKEHLEQVSLILKEHSYICFIESDSLTDEQFRLDYNEFKDVLEYGMNYKKFSATDLWFQTNSI